MLFVIFPLLETTLLGGLETSGQRVYCWYWLTGGCFFLGLWVFVNQHYNSHWSTLLSPEEDIPCQCAEAQWSGPVIFFSCWMDTFECCILQTPPPHGISGYQTNFILCYYPDRLRDSVSPENFQVFSLCLSPRRWHVEIQSKENLSICINLGQMQQMYLCKDL